MYVFDRETKKLKSNPIEEGQKASDADAEVEEESKDQKLNLFKMSSEAHTPTLAKPKSRSRDSSPGLKTGDIFTNKIALEKLNEKIDRKSKKQQSNLIQSMIVPLEQLTLEELTKKKVMKVWNLFSLSQK